MAIGTSNGEYFKDEYELAAKQTSEKPVISSSEEPNQVMSDADERPIAGEQYAMMEGRNRLPLPSEGGVGGEIDKLATGAAPGPGKLSLTPTRVQGYRSKAFDLLDEKGNKFSDMRITLRNEGKDLHVDRIGDLEAYTTVNKAGTGAMKDVLKQIKEYFPDAERIYGLRISGARTGRAEKAYLALKPGVKARPENEYRDDLLEVMRTRNREYQASRTNSSLDQVPFSEADFARNYTAGHPETRQAIEDIMRAWEVSIRENLVTAERTGISKKRAIEHAIKSK